MGKAIFYHVTRRPVEDTLRMLLGKAGQAGLRVVVRARTSERVEWLDEKLWQGPDDSFLPHGMSGGTHDAAQPILLTVDAALPNGATCLMSVDGAEVDPAEVTSLDRVCVLFDGGASEALEVARGQWRLMKAAQVQAEYWSEESGSWEKKAET